MRVAGKLIWPFISALGLIVLCRVFILGAGAPAAEMLNLPDEAGSYAIDDEDVPDVTARAARISFLRGDAQIRRADGGDWEKVVLNLPVVEGDEITTGADARLEIQFDNNQHLRLAENSYLKIITLQDGGIALSISLGTMSVSITRFDKDKTFFEVDAPKTTIAVQKAGIYRIDAGQAGDAEIRIGVTQDGEARVYSDTAGFTLKNGRSARVFIDGANAGEWEAGDYARYSDEFDSWSLDRDATIAQRLKGAFYDRYYDQDIYGADDLNDYGEWIHTAAYGNVWRPYRNSTSYYADWSPYRYGHWRWIPAFGWTWVNDEPWGWATYHHGRWFYDAGDWYWSPYGYYRYPRSWWFPALVVLNVYNNNVCWYPLPYSYAYFNFNSYYYSHGGHHGGGHHGGGHHQPPHPQTGGVHPPHPPPIKIPPSAVVAMGMGDFGTVKTVRKPPLSVANAVIAKKVDDLTDPVLPAYSAITKQIGRDIAAERPKADLVAAQTRVGAAPRKTNAPLDKELRTVRMFGGREPIVNANDTGGVKPVTIVPSDTRKTGAVTRQPIVKQSDTTPPIRQAPVSPPSKTGDDGGGQTVKPQPTRQPPVRQAPVQTDPPVRQPPRVEPAPTRQPPRAEPTPTRQPPVKIEPKQETKPPVKAPPANTSKSSDG